MSLAGLSKLRKRLCLCIVGMHVRAPKSLLHLFIHHLPRRVSLSVLYHTDRPPSTLLKRQQSSQLTDLNPFARAQERHRAAREKKAEEALVTSRATRRHVRDTSPKRPGISFEFPKRIPATAKPTPTDPDTNWDSSVYERSSERAFDRW